MSTVQLLDAAGFADHVDVAGTIYGAAMGKGPESVVQRREILRSHLDRPGLVAAVGRLDPQGDVVGFGYGYVGRPGQWWHDVVAAALDSGGRRRWLADVFEVAELHVLPAAQGRGLGRRLLTTLAATATARTMLLSTPDRETAARHLYRSLGFSDLVADFRFPGSAERYALMGADRSTVLSRPDGT